MNSKTKAGLALTIALGGAVGLAASQVRNTAGQMALVVAACLLGVGAGVMVYRARR